MVRLAPSEPWKSYRELPGYLQRPDDPMHVSPGYCTMQHLLKLGATYYQDTPNLE